VEVFGSGSGADEIYSYAIAFVSGWNVSISAWAREVVGGGGIECAIIVVGVVVRYVIFSYKSSERSQKSGFIVISSIIINKNRRILIIKIKTSIGIITGKIINNIIRYP